MAKILLVEDDVFLSSLLKNRLQKEGIDIIHARDGEEALQNLRSTPISLVLLDIILPKKSGFEVLEEIKSDPQLQAQKIPVMIISNLGQPEDIDRGQNLGATGYFVKAKTSIDDLVARIKEFIKK
ncbi:response regulator [Candidatus Wolfebacteria bacterium CG10_big_fil_rev_8_21_14_0_10_31_9]|uniref:Response regulator n=1 Tax=Candidatus Wolfebacteria bacterium CG10_big_fil_rev_8_21_14_0_10_31_9 TaxID=1975070 RepID=A0A2H0RCR4_9BACT|nr:MAG: response regulator [Candidatus Wolfebacteria bacterium CG10_big_fil_rev_8_21_14_0_10_31_9]